jgi:hypothetical protein
MRRHEWAPSEAAPVAMAGSVWCGVAIDPANAYRLVDRGPPADDKDAAREVSTVQASERRACCFSGGPRIGLPAFSAVADVPAFLVSLLVQFRRVWGPKSELRRFRDGAIVEAVVWASHADRQRVVEEVIRYALGYHEQPR